jgi:hypothetical protein
MTEARAKPATGKQFSEMSFLRKVGFVAKVIVFLATFGFAYPTIFAD